MELKPPMTEISPGVEQRLQRNVSLKSGNSQDDKVQNSARKVAREFEAMFAGFMVKSMRETLGKDSLTGGGRGEEIFRSLLDQEYAQAIAAQGTLGIAKSIENQIIEDNRRAVSGQKGEADMSGLSRKGKGND